MSTYKYRMTEHVAYCNRHIGIGIPSYHIGYEQNAKGEQERLFECSICGHQFRESQGVECDTR